MKRVFGMSTYLFKVCKTSSTAEFVGFENEKLKQENLVEKFKLGKQSETFIIKTYQVSSNPRVPFRVRWDYWRSTENV